MHDSLIEIVKWSKNFGGMKVCMFLHLHVNDVCSTWAFLDSLFHDALRLVGKLLKIDVLNHSLTF